ncbi:MAG: DUF1501 domain-containing protein [Thermoleophilia bacterium]
MTAPRRDGCNDWRMTRRRVASQAGRMMPIPADALDGLAEFERQGGLTRKNLLERGAGLVLMAGAASALGPRAILESAAAQQAASPDGAILVSLYLDGGNDFINTFIPITDPQYRQRRKRIAIPADQILPVSGSSEFGWHPSMSGIAGLYDQGKVAVLPAVDYAQPDQSHFNSQGYWQRGVVGPTLDRTGWLGRTLDLIGTRNNPLQGVSVSWGLDPTLIARKAPIGTVYEPSYFGLGIPEVWDEKGFTKLYREAARGSHSRARQAVSQAYNNAFRMVDMLKPLQGDPNKLPPTPVEYPDSYLGKGMRNAARILGAGLGTRVLSLSRGGFDTHDDQPDEHTELLKDVSDSVAAFQADIQARGLADRVVVMIWSEFGRRPDDNDGNGTDHGAGGGLMLVGNRVNGGIRSEFPGLTDLDSDDNLKVTTEFRTVYASLLESWMGVEAGKILPKMDSRRLPLIR